MYAVKLFVTFTYKSKSQQRNRTNSMLTYRSLGQKETMSQHNIGKVQLAYLRCISQTPYAVLTQILEEYILLLLNKP